jgi:acetyl-CoA/propionyl-CoA carboxylase carboxyl transferase subunit
VLTDGTVTASTGEVVVAIGTLAAPSAGTADAVDVTVFATDPRTSGGALSAAGCAAIADAYAAAIAAERPVLGIWHSGGARLHEGVASLDGVGRVFAAMTRASGRIPQISVVLGPAAGGAAYGPALTDLVVLGPAARVFVTGPDVIRMVTGEDIDMASLGGPEPHGTRSGLAAVTADSDEEALDTGVELVRLLGDRDRPGPVADRPLGRLLPARERQAYDVRDLVDELLDEPSLELFPGWAPNLVTALGRLGGRTVGVLAPNPMVLAGCLDAASGDKGGRFVRLCDAFGVPLIVLVDTPGYLPGTDQEWNGVVRRGAKLVHAFAEASVPRFTVVLRKAFGGAYIALNSRSLGATRVYAWPSAQLDVMGPEAAVRVLHRRRLAEVPEPARAALASQLAAEHRHATGGLGRAVEVGAVDEVIDPDRTRSVLAAALASAVSGTGTDDDPAAVWRERRRGRHGNLPL